LLYLWRTVFERGGGRLVHVAFALSYFVHRRLWDSSDHCGRLVRTGRGKEGTMKTKQASASKRMGMLIAILVVVALSGLLLHRPMSQWISVRLLLRSENPHEDWFTELASQSPNPAGFLERCWATGKVPHRQLVTAFLKEKALANPAWLSSVERLVMNGTQDGDMSVRELALATMESRKDPLLFDCAEAQLVDPDPLVRQLGLDYLRKTEPARGLPVVIRLLDDPDLRVVTRAETALTRWTGQDLGVRVRMAIPGSEGAQANEVPTENVEKIQDAVKRRKAWWREHAAEFTSKPKAFTRNLQGFGRPQVTDFTLRDLDGKPVRLSDFLGRPVLINFWATWCTACLAEIPDLIALQKKLGERVAIVGVALDGATDEHGHVPGEEHEGEVRSRAASLEKIQKKVERAVKARAINYTVLLDPSSTVGGRFNGGELPTTVIIDASGRFQRRFIGERNLKVFEAMIAQAEQPNAEMPSR
jgi:thiol-disulfide isomerase/thioredoxin